jgi:hypothetical protein
VYVVAIALLIVEIIVVIIPMSIKVRSRTCEFELRCSCRCSSSSSWQAGLACVCADVQIERDKFHVFRLFMSVPPIVVRHLSKQAQQSYQTKLAEVRRDSDDESDNSKDGIEEVCVWTCLDRVVRWPDDALMMRCHRNANVGCRF